MWELNWIGIVRERKRKRKRERRKRERKERVNTIFIDGLSGLVRHVHVSHEHVAACDSHEKRSREEKSEEAVQCITGREK